MSKGHDESAYFDHVPGSKGDWSMILRLLVPIDLADAKQTVADTNGFFELCTCAVTFTRHPEGFEVRFLKHTVGVDPDIEL